MIAKEGGNEVKLMTIKDAARDIGINPSTLRRRVASGMYAHMEVGGRTMVDVDDIRLKDAAARGERAELLTPEQFAGLTGLTGRQVRRLIGEGKLSARKLGRRVMLGRTQALRELAALLRAEDEEAQDND